MWKSVENGVGEGFLKNKLVDKSVRIFFKYNFIHKGIDYV